MADAALPPELQDFLFAIVGVFTVVVFAGHVFPKQLEEEGEGHLPKRFIASAIFVAINVFIYVFLVCMVLLTRNYQQIRVFLEQAGTPEVNAALDRILGQNRGASLTAMALFFALFGFRRWRKIEVGALRQLHSVNLVEDDAKDLIDTIRTCPLRTCAKGGEALHELQKLVAPHDAANPRTALAVKWSKLQILLDQWSSDRGWSESLPKVDLPNVAAARLAHDRRTMLANRVFEHIRRIQRGEADPGDLSNLASIVEGIRADTSASRQDILERLNGALSGKAGAKMFDTNALTRILTPLINYFNEEYDEQLSAFASATAKSVIMSGDDIGKRLAALRKCGFSGIGDIKPISLHKAILITFAVFFALLFLFSLVHAIIPPPPKAKLAPPPEIGSLMPILMIGSLTLAVVLGVMVGGLRNLARAAEVPWAWYFLAAGAIAIVHAVAMFSIAFFVIPREFAPKLSASLLFLMPLFVMVLGICLLGRYKYPYPQIQRCNWCQRVLDGLLLGAALAAAALVVALGPVPTAADANLPPPPWWLLPFVLGLQGLLIGALVVRYVRDAAVTSLTSEEESPDADPRTEPPERVPEPAVGTVDPRPLLTAHS